MLQVSQAFNLSGRGIAVFIKNVEAGLPENTILYSGERQLQWKVIHRMIWMHSAHAVVRFPNEKESIGHAGFNYSSNEDPVEKAIEATSKSGLEYLIRPVDHSEKPLDGEYLLIKI
jgi:hypothetical protein